MSDQFVIHQQEVASTTSSTRRGNAVHLVVLHSDPRPAATVLAESMAPDATRAPHYYIDAQGRISGLVAEQRAAHHSGLATWENRRRNIDLISIGVVLEHSSGARVALPQHISLYWLVQQLGRRHDVTDEHVLAWVPDIQRPHHGRLMPLHLPPPVLDPAGDRDGGISFDLTTDPLWVFLQSETYRQRGVRLNAGWAFHQRASANRLGAPLAAAARPPLSFGGRQYGYQVFGSDTLFNENPKWAEVQSLNALLAGTMPTAGLAYELLAASYQASGSPLFKDWAFHHVAVREKLGTPLGNAGEIPVGNQRVNFQVFSGDTLYTLLAEPAENTDWSDVRRLSATEPGDLADALWTETYKISGAPYDKHSLFHQHALEAKIGTPLTAPYQGKVGGVSFTLQVFGRDTLYHDESGQVQHLSSLDPGIAAVELSAAAPPPAAAPISANSSPDWPPPPSFGLLPNTAARQQTFGAFQFVHEPVAGNPENIRITDGWQQHNIVPVTIPQLIGVRGAPRNGVVLFHRLAAKQLAAMWAAWEAAGLIDRVLVWAGSFVPRFIRGSRSELSNHAFGTAFDINVRWNGLGAQPALVGQQGCVRELVPIANEHGFYWGGHFRGRPDGMHFEVAELRS
jgi:hypothetical protein